MVWARLRLMATPKEACSSDSTKKLAGRKSLRNKTQHFREALLGSRRAENQLNIVPSK